MNWPLKIYFKKLATFYVNMASVVELHLTLQRAMKKMSNFEKSSKTSKCKTCPKHHANKSAHRN